MEREGVGRRGLRRRKMEDSMAQAGALPALVIGGGIGGLTAAIALQRVGMEAAVFERAGALEEAGAGLTLWPNAISALRRIGLGGALATVGQPVTHSRILSWRGDVLADLPVGLLERRFGAPMMGVHRGELQSALVAALAPGTLSTGAACVGFTHDAGGVHARLAGDQEAAGVLLVGADGIRSTIRAQLWGQAPLRYAGYTAWRGVARVPSRLWPAETASEIWGAGKRFGLVPLTGGRVYWFAAVNAPESAPEGAPGRPSGRQRELLDRFHGWPDAVLAAIEGTDEPAILRNDIYDRPPLAHWSQGRVTLLGDAAHPMTPNMGQGACQAIEDAAALAACLASTRNVTAALRAYERRRLARANAIVRQSLGIGQIAQWEQPWLVGARNLALKLTPTTLVVRQMAWALRPV